MKFKIVITLLFLTGSAFSQLITTREESEFMSSYPTDALLTFTGSGGSIPFHAHSPLRSSLSFRENFSATPVFADTPRFGASPHGAGLPCFAGYSVAGGESLDATPAAQADTFPISHDQAVFALIAASTIP